MTDKTAEKKKYLTHPDSKYRLILIAAKRSKQIQKGSQPRLVPMAHKPTRIALEEVHKGLVPFEILPPREVEKIIST